MRSTTPQGVGRNCEGTKPLKATALHTPKSVAKPSVLSSQNSFAVSASRFIARVS